MHLGKTFYMAIIPWNPWDPNEPNKVSWAETYMILHGTELKYAYFLSQRCLMPTESSQTSRRDTHKKVGRIRPWRHSFSEVLLLSKKQTERLRRVSNRGKSYNFFSSAQTWCISERNWDMPWNVTRILLIFWYEKTWSFMQYKTEG